MHPTSFKPALTPDFIVRSLHLKVPVLPRPHLPFANITTDSRTLLPGSLFVAIKGDNFDGHSFIEDAITKGARAILCKKGTPVPNARDVSIFSVEDPLGAYRRIAASWRKEFPIPVIAVAGSAGKTTTKELLAAILQGKWSRVLKTQGSQNGFVGIPMTLLELRPEHEAAIIEVGIDDIGSMQQHMALVSPNASVLTAIGAEHLLNLRDVPTVAREEGIALSFVAKAGGMVAINLDDPWIRPHVTTLREGRKIPFSMNGATSEIDMIKGELSADGQELNFRGLGIQEATVSLPLPGKHNASNLLAAITLAAGLGLTSEEIKKGLLTFEGAEGRSQVRELNNSVTVICDYYNAQPASMEAGLDLLAELSQRSKTARPRWACLGDMLELGTNEEKLHRDLAKKILATGVENVLLFGTSMAALHDQLQKDGFKGRLAHFTDREDLAAELIHRVRAGDIILIKGSKSMKMGEVWKALEPHGSKTHESKNSIAHT
jgi:UDP-N-acetylmuramoyl-tripeptide--D-alanyl-D-alanine ligase